MLGVHIILAGIQLRCAQIDFCHVAPLRDDYFSFSTLHSSDIFCKTKALLFSSSRSSDCVCICNFFPIITHKLLFNYIPISILFARNKVFQLKIKQQENETAPFRSICAIRYLRSPPPNSLIGYYCPVARFKNLFVFLFFSAQLFRF